MNLERKVETLSEPKNIEAALRKMDGSVRLLAQKGDKSVTIGGGELLALTGYFGDSAQGHAYISLSRVIDTLRLTGDPDKVKEVYDDAVKLGLMIIDKRGEIREYKMGEAVRQYVAENIDRILTWQVKRFIENNARSIDYRIQQRTLALKFPSPPGPNNGV